MPTHSDQFITTDDYIWPLTPRTRYVLWQSLAQVSAAIDMDLSGVRAGGDVERVAQDPGSFILNEFPMITRTQALDWWEQVLDAARRLRDAMRTDVDVRPQSVAEEVVLFLASQPDGWVALALDVLEPDQRAELDRLPADDDDFLWEEVLPALADDVDVESLWLPERDGIGDPADSINQELGMRDYRTQSWNRTYE